MLRKLILPSTLQVETCSGHSHRQSVGCQASPSGHLNWCSTPSTQLTKSPQLFPFLNIPHFRGQFPFALPAAKNHYQFIINKMKLEYTYRQLWFRVFVVLTLTRQRPVATVNVDRIITRITERSGCNVHQESIRTCNFCGDTIATFQIFVTLGCIREISIRGRTSVVT